jgi:hypothetical protein
MQSGRQAVRSACDNGRSLTEISREVYKCPQTSRFKLNRFLKNCWRGMKLETAEKLLDTLGLYITLHCVDEQQQAPTLKPERVTPPADRPHQSGTPDDDQ